MDEQLNGDMTTGRQDAAALVDEIATLTFQGVDVQVNRTYARSWDGIYAASRMGSTQLSPSDRFFATIDYFSHACPNASEVAAALAEARPGTEVTGNDVLEFLSEAIKKGVPKN